MKITFSINAIAFAFFHVFILNSTTLSEEIYKSEDFMHYLELLKADDTHNRSPAYYNAFKERGFEPKPRIFELMRRVGLNHSAFGELNNQNIALLLQSQIDKKLFDINAINNGNDGIIDGILSLRILVSQENQVIRILYFNRKNIHDDNIILTQWTRNFPSAMIDMQTPPSDWKAPIKSRKKWPISDFAWLRPIFQDPMPPVDYPSEVTDDMTVSVIIEAVIIENRSASYKWAIRSSLQTAGYLRKFQPVFTDFLQKINEDNIDETIDEKKRSIRDPQ